MKKIFLIAMAMLMTFAMAGCNRVPNGYVGVQFNQYGDDRGVDTKLLDPGTYMASWNTKVELLPTFTQSDKWEGDAQTIRFQVAGGINMNTDIQISYHIDKANAIDVFKKYRQPIDVISDHFLRSFVRDEFNVAGINYDVESLQGAGKAKLLDEVTAAVQKKAAGIGITVEGLSYLGALHFPDNVVTSINAKIQATQDAMRVENEVRKTKAEQDKTVVIAEAQVKVAEAQAQAIELRGKAYRDNPQVLQREIAEMQANALRDTKIQYLGTLPMMFKNVQ